MFDLIEKVVYINLDNRTDRREEIQKELFPVFPPEKIIRFPAIRKENGAIGCTLSHISVLEMAKKEGWKNVLILEDDFMWTNRTGIPVLEKLLQHSFDVIVLTGAYVLCNPETYRLTSCQTATSYIVSEKYYDKLLTNYREGLELFMKTGNYQKYALDQHWKILQPVDFWYFILPSLGQQRPGYSDIEKRVVNYSPFFNIVN